MRDLEGMKPIELSKEIGCSHQEALQILRTIQNDLSQVNDNPHLANNNAESVANAETNFNTFGFQPNKTRDLIEGQTAFSLLEKEVDSTPIITFNQAIDDMLGGGVACGKLTEFCGVPGIGKTQMGIQLAVNVHIPKAFGGSEGECIYIDTEGSFMVERVVEMATALVKHLEAVSQANEGMQMTLTVEHILDHIYYFRVHDHIEQIALINTLPLFIESHPNVKLLVIDSITFHFRHDFEDMRVRTRLLNQMAGQLTSMAAKNSMAVVVINQVTTKMEGNTVSLVPALGETWAHACTERITLQWAPTGTANSNGTECRIARLVKSSSQRAQAVPYQITPEGIRNFDAPASNVNNE